MAEQAGSAEQGGSGGRALRRANGRVALVTGGARGFGQAIARRLAEDGHSIVVVDVLDTTETEKLVREVGAPFLGIKADLTSRADLDELAPAIESALGPVDVLVANAAISPIAPFLGMSRETWDKTMDVNLNSIFDLLQIFLPGMVEREWGRVIAMVSGSFNMPPPGFSAYVSSKGALIGLLRTLSHEVGAAGVTVNAVAPPLVETPGVAAGPQRKMGVFEIVVNAQAIKREGKVDDIAGVYSFLASDDADMITGQTVCVDGGAVHF